MKFKKNNGKLIFSEKLIISENSKDSISMDVVDKNYFSLLENYKKNLKNLILTIYLENENFETFQLNLADKILEIDDIEDYIEFWIRENLNEVIFDDFFLKYYEISNGIYKIFIFYRAFIEDLIEFIIENNLLVEKIIIQDEDKEYILDDYDKVIGPAKKNKNVAIFFIVSILLVSVFLILKLYNYKLEKQIATCESKIYLKDRKINNLKIKQENIEKIVLNLENEKNNEIQENKTFENRIFRILKLIPDNITLSYIHFENNKLILKGKSENKNSIFTLTKFLEKDSQITTIKYDYITKLQNFYIFLIEVTVL